MPEVRRSSLRPQTSIARRVVVGTLSNSAAVAVVVVANLALLPFVLREVGATAYGLWILVGSITSFIGLLDIGIAAALIKFVAEHVARQDPDEAARMFGAATVVYVVLAVLAMLLGVCFALVLPDVFGLEDENRRTAQSLMVLGTLAAAISIPGVAPLAVLRGLQRFAVANAITAGVALLSSALTVVALILDAGIVGVAAAAVVGAAVGLVVSAVVVHRVAPEIARLPRRRTGDAQRIRPLLTFSAPVALVQVAGRLQFRMDAIIIGAALPVSAIAPYNFAQRLAEGTRLFAEQFTRVLLPLATELGTATGAAAVHRLLLTSTRLTLGLALAVGVPLGLFGGQVLGIWVGAEYERFGLLVALLAVSAVMDVATYPATAILQGSNRHRPIAVFALLSGVVNVGLSVLLVRSLGSTGVALATLLATIAEIGVLLLPYLSRVLEVPASVAARQVVGRLVVPVGAYVLLLEGLVLALPLTSLRNLAAVLAIALIGYGLAYVRVGADAYERTAYRTAATAVRTLMRTQLSTRGR